MKHCYKYAILCGVIALGLMFVSTKLGVPAYLTPFAAPLMMVACCVLPMVLLMFTSKSKEGSGGCCSGGNKNKLVPVTGTGSKEKSSCCH